MKIQIQPSRWSCLPTAIAMVLDCKVKFVIDKIGHDGSEIVWPELKEPNNRRSFHIQEIIDYVWWHGFKLTPFEPSPHSVTESIPYKLEFPNGNQQRILKVLKSNSGILIGQSLPSGNHHAVAWCNETGRIYNPNGSVQDISDFAIRTFWALG